MERFVVLAAGAVGGGGDLSRGGFGLGPPRVVLFEKQLAGLGIGGGQFLQREGGDGGFEFDLREVGHRRGGRVGDIEGDLGGRRGRGLLGEGVGVPRPDGVGGLGRSGGRFGFRWRLRQLEREGPVARLGRWQFGRGRGGRGLRGDGGDGRGVEDHGRGVRRGEGEVGWRWQFRGRRRLEPRRRHRLRRGGHGGLAGGEFGHVLAQLQRHLLAREGGVAHGGNGIGDLADKGIGHDPHREEQQDAEMHEGGGEEAGDGHRHRHAALLAGEEVEEPEQQRERRGEEQEPQPVVAEEGQEAGEVGAVPFGEHFAAGGLVQVEGVRVLVAEVAAEGEPEALQGRGRVHLVGGGVDRRAQRLRRADLAIDDAAAVEVEAAGPARAVGAEEQEFAAGAEGDLPLVPRRVEPGQPPRLADHALRVDVGREDVEIARGDIAALGGLPLRARRRGRRTVGPVGGEEQLRAVGADGRTVLVVHRVDGGAEVDRLAPVAGFGGAPADPEVVAARPALAVGVEVERAAVGVEGRAEFVGRGIDGGQRLGIGPAEALAVGDHEFGVVLGPALGEDEEFPVAGDHRFDAVDLVVAQEFGLVPEHAARGRAAGGLAERDPVGPGPAPAAAPQPRRSHRREQRHRADTEPGSTIHLRPRYAGPRPDHKGNRAAIAAREVAVVRSPAFGPPAAASRVSCWTHTSGRACSSDLQVAVGSVGRM